MGKTECTVHGFRRIGNFFLVVHERELTLIDTGAKDKVENIRRKFQRADQDLDRLTRIVATHCHFDHVGSMAALRRATGAQVLAHEAEAPIITREARLPRPRGGPAWILHTLTEPIFRPERCEVDGTLKHGDTVGESGLTVIHTPGHTPGSICLYHREMKLLFTGDAFVHMGGRVSGPVAAFSSDSGQARRSLALLAELDVETIYFAHGGTIREGANETIRALVGAYNR